MNKNVEALLSDIDKLVARAEEAEKLYKAQVEVTSAWQEKFALLSKDCQEKYNTLAKELNARLDEARRRFDDKAKDAAGFEDAWRAVAKERDHARAEKARLQEQLEKLSKEKTFTMRMEADSTVREQMTIQTDCFQQQIKNHDSLLELTRLSMDANMRMASSLEGIANILKKMLAVQNGAR